MRKISRMQRHRVMKALLKSATSVNSDLVKPHAPELYKYRRHGDFERTISVLEGLGLVEVIHRSAAKPARYRITPNGKCYFERLADERRKWILNSILVPVLVSLITAALTVYVLPSLGKRAEAWLSGMRHQTEELSPTPAPTSDPQETLQTDPTPSIPETRELPQEVA